MKPLSVPHSDAISIGRPSLYASVMVRRIAGSSLRMVDHLLIEVLRDLAGKVDSIINNFACSQRLEIRFRTVDTSQL